MMQTLEDLIQELEQRLPELAWRLQKINMAFLYKSLPQGLFTISSDASFSDYIQDITFELSRLQQASSPAIQQFLGDKIKRKVNVLVNICVQPQNKAATVETKLNIKRFRTRHQWLQDAEKEIVQLKQQYTALLNTANRDYLNTAAQLNIQQELGELQKKITLAEEAYQAITT